MNNDEFNLPTVNNEIDGFPNFEFGLVQDIEFTFKSDNKIDISDEVNDSDNINSDNNVKEKEEKKIEKKNNTNQDNDNIDKIKDLTSTSSTSSATSSSISASTTSSVVSSATVSVAATVVGVSAISTVVGINLYFNAKCNVNVIEPTPVSLNYDLELSDINEDKVIINLENQDNSFIESKELKEGNNSGYFTSLLPSTKYTLSVVDITYNNYVLYTKEVSTLDNNIISYKIDNQVEYNSDYFEIDLSFNNDKNINDIKFHLLNSLNNEKIYNLETKTGKQKIMLNNDDKIKFSFDDNKGFNYYLSYKYKNSEVKSDINHILFNVNYPSSKLNYFKIDYVEKETSSFSVSFDLIDYKKIYNNPRIYFEDENTNQVEIKLDLTKKTQVITEYDLNYYSGVYKYSFVCNNKENNKDEILATSLVEMDMIEKRFFAAAQLQDYYFTINNKPYILLNTIQNDYNNELGDLFFVYQTSSDSTKKRVKIKKVSGLQEICLDEDTSNLNIYSYQIISYINNEEYILYEDTTNIELQVVNSPTIMGGYLDSFYIDKNNPNLTLHLIHNDYETKSIKDVSLFIFDSYPPQVSFEYQIDISNVDFISNNNININLKDHPEYEKLFELLSSSFVIIGVQYQIDDSSQQEGSYIYDPVNLYMLN